LSTVPESSKGLLMLTDRARSSAAPTTTRITVTTAATVNPTTQLLCDRGCAAEDGGPTARLGVAITSGSRWIAATSSEKTWPQFGHCGEIVEIRSPHSGQSTSANSNPPGLTPILAVR